MEHNVNRTKIPHAQPNRSRWCHAFPKEGFGSLARVACFYVYWNVMLCFPYGPPTSQTCTGPWNEIDLLFNVAAYRTISNIIDGSGHSIFLIESKILCHSSSNLSGVSLYMRQRCILDGLRTDVGGFSFCVKLDKFWSIHDQMKHWNGSMILPPKSSKHPEAHVDYQSYPNSSKATITCKSEYANDTDNSDKDLMIQIQYNL